MNTSYHYTNIFVLPGEALHVNLTVLLLLLLYFNINDNLKNISDLSHNQL